MDHRPHRNPVLPPRRPTTPPVTRSRFALGLTAAAATGRLALQECLDCGAIQYPAREACRHCLSDRLEWRERDGAGTLQAETCVRKPYETYFRERAPWRTGLVRLDCGVSVVAYLHGGCAEPPARVQVRPYLDRAGRAVLVALPQEDIIDMTDDPLIRELTNSPKGRNVLITDGTSEIGQAMAIAAAEAGAETVWVGASEPWKAAPGFEALSAVPQVTLLPLDVTDTQSVDTLAGQIGGKVDILINTAEFHRTHSALSRRGVETARAEMEVNYLGLLRLSQAFGPAMSARAAEIPTNAVAWVNVLSVFALANYPAQGTFSASKAAALSLAQCLRAEFRPAGLRVLNVFPGPVDEAWNQTELPPKVAPRRLAADIVRALEDGLEDLFPDPIARDWYERWRADPKVLELELTA
ncbi:SDR family NAD(P)-dependent oxidoreductase [Amorphus orientalis]|uniref:NAD(P)-dependent dehydrogenase (Short-subunit alcohol dehydrogenase family)/uncharacterized OB-fold protein n=1 Tax=Amorphus orientalis TaxID=649198 RepID=A0AAE3VNR0_9HYPH|nr:SDR family NAD(P)-dependent oxidoreductase [Amorphus orientalis]MDQ0315443.1 NAD(P)-dependent dehydrogenase (short-subunit alcohol dehydrogenase family)/uncharacterized OB-fold protein [Amorphus orientalis]